MRQIQFIVPAIPIAQPRQRHRVMRIGGRTIAQNYTPKKDPVNQFKATVALVASEHTNGSPPHEGPGDIGFEICSSTAQVESVED